MSQTFFFYDLETSGINPAASRIMQFAGQRTDMDLNIVGEPVNILVKLSEDILPEPYAVNVHGITPQKTLEEGLTEPEFCKYISEKVFTPNTIVVGFNSVRFDDEFIRNTFYRNFYDPYEREWSDMRSRWDVLDLFRMARALRPDGIQWPVVKGKPSNRLEELAKANKVEHANAHDALADVLATIELTKLMKKTNPKLYEWSLKTKSKKEVARLVDLNNPHPVVHSSGRYSSDNVKTSVVLPIAPAPNNPNAVVVYDLRVDPTQFVDLSPKELAKHVFAKKDDELERLPIKNLAYNKCPAVAPLGVLDDDAKKRINIDMNNVKKHIAVLDKNKHFGDLVRSTLEDVQKDYDHSDVEFQIYQGFLNDKDKAFALQIRNADKNSISEIHPAFLDERLDELFFRYKARNFTTSLTEDEQKKWQDYKQSRFDGKIKKVPGVKDFLKQLEAVSRTADTFLVDELKLYLEAIL